MGHNRSDLPREGGQGSLDWLGLVGADFLPLPVGWHIWHWLQHSARLWPEAGDPIVLCIIFFGFVLSFFLGRWGMELTASCTGITESSWWWLQEKEHTPKYSHSCSFYVIHWYLLGCFNLFQWGYFPIIVSSELFYSQYIKVLFTKKMTFSDVNLLGLKYLCLLCQTHIH